MRRFVTFTLAAVMLFTAFLTKAGVAPASAATISPGCAYVNANGGSGNGLYVDMRSYLTFYAGETLSVTGSNPARDVVYIYNYASDTSVGDDGSSPVNYTIPTTGLYRFDLDWDGYADSDVITISCSPVSVPGVPVQLFNDERVNGDVSQAGQTFAAYCTNGAITVYVIDPATGNGTFAFKATTIDILKASLNQPANSGNLVIKSGKGATLYLLSDGQYQVNRAEANTGKMYSYVFSCTL